MLDSIAGSGMSFLIGIVLARMLSPAIFGLIGMVTVFFAIANTFIDSGFSTGLIRKVKCTNIEYDTVFYFNTCVSCIIYLILYIIAPFISNFFNEPQLINLIRVLSAVIVIDSLSIVQRAIFTRDLNFKIQTLISLISTLSSGIVGIGMAYEGYGVWSLVFQLLIKQLLNGIFLWIFSNWRPSMNFSLEAFKELFKFGSRLLGSGLIVTIQNNIYYFIIGKFFSASGLGFYTRAEQFNSIITNNITGTFEKVFFPVLASIQEEEERFLNTLRRMLRTSFFISYFALMVLFIVAKPMINLLIGPQWGQSVLYLKLICLGSVFFPLNVVNTNILKVKGRSDLILRLQLIKTSLTIVVILAAIYWGLTIMLIVRIITVIITTYLNSLYSAELVGYSIREQLLDIKPYFVSESVILIVMFGLGFIQANSFSILCIQIFTGIILFILIFEKLKYAEYIEIKEMIIRTIRQGILIK
jgi:teichuronic acid exporter